MRPFELYTVDTDFSEYEFEEIQRGIGSGCRNQIVPVRMPEAIAQRNGINRKCNSRKCVSESDTDIVDMDFPAVQAFLGFCFNKGNNLFFMLFQIDPSTNKKE